MADVDIGRYLLRLTRQNGTLSADDVLRDLTRTGFAITDPELITAFVDAGFTQAGVGSWELSAVTVAEALEDTRAALRALHASATGILAMIDLGEMMTPNGGTVSELRGTHLQAGTILEE